MNVSDLLSKIALGEDSSLELKEVHFTGERISAPRRESLADELASFANGRGGLCVLGVEDETRRIVGIPFDKLDLSESFVREICNDSIDPPLVAHIDKQCLPNANGVEVPVLCIEVPKSLFVHKSPGGYFYRIGSSKREMTPDYLSRLFQQRSQSRLIRFDEQIVSGTTLDNLDETVWGHFRSPRIPNETREALLSKLRMARRDEEGVLRPTVAGVLFGSDEPRKFLSNAFIQAVAYKGTFAGPEPGVFPYQLDAADITGPIDAQIIDALRFVARNMRTYATKDLGRRDYPQFDLTSVFEAIVNAVAHRDYGIYGSKIRLRLFANRLELMSPGALPNTMTVENLPEMQFARNEIVTTLLARLPIPETSFELQTTRKTFMDKRGEGVSVILERSEQLSGRRPEYREIADRELQLTIWAFDPAPSAASTPE